MRGSFSSLGRWLPVAPFVCFAATVAAQDQTQQSPVFRAERHEVEVVVSVRDSKGNPALNLRPEDFEIRDNGKLQNITSFAVQGGTAEPAAFTQGTQAAAFPAVSTSIQRRFVALFFDDVLTEPGDFGRIQRAAAQFVREGLQAEDRVAIFKASESGEVTFTNDQAKLLSTIDALRATSGPSMAQCPRITNYEAYLIVNQLDPEALTTVAERMKDCMCPPPNSGGCPTMDDFKRMSESLAGGTSQSERQVVQRLLAALDLAVRVLGTMPGRRTLILNSSGFLSSNQENDLDRVVDNALYYGVVINALSAKGVKAEIPGGKASEQRLDGSASVRPATSRYETQETFARMDAENAGMTNLSDSTGGKFFRNSNDLVQGLNNLMANDGVYSLSFSPHPLKRDGKFHKLTVRVRRGGVIVYARRGYFARSGKNLATEGEPGLGPPAAPPSSIPAAAESTLPPTATAEPPKLAATEKDEAAKSSAEESREPRGTVPNTSAKPSSPTADLPSDSAFLGRASREVQRYIAAFADLTADETRIMQSFDERGLPAKQRSMQSELVIYRLRNDPKSVIEYRQVVSVDGHEVKGHAARATKLWQEIAQARSPEEEIRRLNSDSQRYDIGMAQSGFTLFEGLPLRTDCAGDFAFREQARAVEKGRAVRVFSYRQTRPCKSVRYHFGLPAGLADSPMLHAGVLMLDAETGQIVHEDRNVYVGHSGKNAPRVAKIILSYGDSQFGILVPQMIEIETFVPRVDIDGAYTGFLPYARTVQSYSPFLRFEVSVGEKALERAH